LLEPIGSEPGRIAMNRAAKLLTVVLLLTVAVGVFASDASSPRAGKSWSLTLFHPTRVGTALLPPGDYSVRHVMDGEKHFLVFKSDRKELARVACSEEQLPAKVDKTALMENTNSAGERVLMGIAFQGDHFRHNLGESVAQAR
jgi:hypothetical protein